MADRGLRLRQHPLLSDQLGDPPGDGNDRALRRSRSLPEYRGAGLRRPLRGSFHHQGSGAGLLPDVPGRQSGAGPLPHHRRTSVQGLPVAELPDQRHRHRAFDAAHRLPGPGYQPRGGHRRGGCVPGEKGGRRRLRRSSGESASAALSDLRDPLFRRLRSVQLHHAAGHGRRPRGQGGRALRNGVQSQLHHGCDLHPHHYKALCQNAGHRKDAHGSASGLRGLSGLPSAAGLHPKLLSCHADLHLGRDLLHRGGGAVRLHPGPGQPPGADQQSDGRRLYAGHGRFGYLRRAAL